MILLLLRSLFGRRPAAPGRRTVALADQARSVLLTGGRAIALGVAARTAHLAGGRTITLAPTARSVRLIDP